MDGCTGRYIPRSAEVYVSAEIQKTAQVRRGGCLCYMGEPGVRYNVVWLREIWRIPLPLPLKFRLHRLPRPALPGRDAPRPRFAR